MNNMKKCRIYKHRNFKLGLSVQKSLIPSLKKNILWI